MDEFSELSGRERRLLRRVDEIVAGGRREREEDSLYGLCAHLAGTVPKASEPFRDHLEAQLLSKLRERQAVSSEAGGDTVRRSEQPLPEAGLNVRGREGLPWWRRPFVLSEGPPAESTGIAVDGHADRRKAPIRPGAPSLLSAGAFITLTVLIVAAATLLLGRTASRLADTPNIGNIDGAATPSPTAPAPVPVSTATARPTATSEPVLSSTPVPVSTPKPTLTKSLTRPPTSTATPTPAPIVTRQSAPAPITTTTPGPPPEGLITFIAERDRDPDAYAIYLVRPDGSGITELTGDELPGLPSGLTWSPDGTRLAFRLAWYDSPSGQQAEIYAVNADGSGLIQLTRTPDLLEADPAWSPSGTRIAYSAYRTDTEPGEAVADIYVMGSDGGSRVRLLANGRVNTHPVWSPNDERIALASFDGRAESSAESDTRIYLMDADGSNLVRLAGYDPDTLEAAVAWSPDGTRIAFMSGQDIYVVSPQGGRPRRLTNSPPDGARHPTWSPDSKRIAYLAADAVYVMNSDGSGGTRIVSGDGIQSLAWSPADVRPTLIKRR